MNREISEKLDEHETNIISKLEREKVYKIICLITARIIMQEGEIIQAYVYGTISDYPSWKTF